MHILKRATSLLFLAVCLYAQNLIVSPADITGDAAAHALATSGTATWIIFATPTTNSAVVRIGDVNTSSSRGFPIAVGGALFFPVIPGAVNYDLTKIYYYAATGDKLYLEYAK